MAYGSLIASMQMQQSCSLFTDRSGAAAVAGAAASGTFAEAFAGAAVPAVGSGLGCGASAIPTASAIQGGEGMFVSAITPTALNTHRRAWWFRLQSDAKKHLVTGDWLAVGVEATL